nr:glycosyltransferase family 4 protein [Chloroflexota bacterium]
ILARLGLQPSRYVLSLGGLDARKNQVRLVQAFELLGHDHADLRLVLVGGGTWREWLIRRRIEGSSARGRVVFAGFVTDEDLAALLVNAGVFAYVSLNEGFGLPILEAMAAGAPVVTSRVSSMPEVAGEAAILVDPRDSTAIARGITSALGPRREELVEAGRARAASRTWNDVAAEMLDVYDRASARARDSLG